MPAYQLRSRSARRQPQRYDDLDYHDHNQDEVHRRTASPVEKMQRYTGPVIKYNPNLRPAVFPTIPLDQEIEESDSESVALPGEPLQASRNFQANHPQPIPAFESTRSDHKFPLEIFDFSSFTDPDMFHATSTNDRWSRQLNKSLRTSPPRTPSPTAMNDSPENQTYMRNLKLMEKFSARTDTDWNIAEMETSDEDDEKEKTTPTEQRMLDWDKLSVAHRLDLVDVVDEEHNCLEKTFKLLRLTSQQKDSTVNILHERNQYLDARDGAMKLVQDKTSEILLGGNQDHITWLTKNGGYEKLMEENVYQYLDKFDYLTSKRSELHLAKQYLAFCGFKPDLLDHWQSPAICKIGPAVTEPSEPETSEPEPPEPEPSEPKKHIAAFPTIPLVDSHRPEEMAKKGIHPSDESVGEATLPRPPLANFNQPKAASRNGKRRHTAIEQETANRGLRLQSANDGHQGKVSVDADRPARVNPPNDQSHQRAHVSTNLENRQFLRPEPVLTEPQHSVQPSRVQAVRHNGYRIPHVAQPFALPPQLAQQKHLWLPDTTQNTTSAQSSLPQKPTDLDLTVIDPALWPAPSGFARTQRLPQSAQKQG